MNNVDRITRRTRDEVHDYIAPDCGQRAQLAFVAAENGRFASRDIRKGDFIDLCPPHGHDVHQAQNRRAELPEWLRMDAKPDTHEDLLRFTGTSE
jgi:hypothetical protein